MAVKKVAKKVAVTKMYAMNSTSDFELYDPKTKDEVDKTLDDWEFEDGEVVTVYELVPVKRYKKGVKYVEIK